MELFIILTLFFLYSLIGLKLLLIMPSYLIFEHLKKNRLKDIKEFGNKNKKYKIITFPSVNAIKLIDYYNKINEENSCVQNFTYDLAAPYLMKKPSCTKYFSSWIASPTTKQQDYINEIIHIKPQYILYKSSGTNFGLTYKVELPEIFERLALVNSYILANYKKHKEFDGYIILEKK